MITFFHFRKVSLSLFLFFLWNLSFFLPVSVLIFFHSFIHLFILCLIYFFCKLKSFKTNKQTKIISCRRLSIVWRSTKSHGAAFQSSLQSARRQQSRFCHSECSIDNISTSINLSLLLSSSLTL